MADPRKYFTRSSIKSTSSTTSVVRRSTSSLTTFEQKFSFPAIAAESLRIGNATRSTNPAISFSKNSTDSYCLETGKACVYIFNFNKFNDSNIPVRKGSEHDVNLLKGFFSKYRVKQLKFYSDLRLAEVRKKMTRVSKKKFDDCSCAIFVIMSHGDTREQIHSYDKMFNLEDDVIEKVLMNETLKGKPKLFFVQACKGDAQMETDFRPSATNKNDIYKCYGTYEGTLCWRNANKGTEFIQNLFPLIGSNGEKDIAQIMTLLRKKFVEEQIRQAPTDTSTLTKQFFFQELKL